MYDPKNGKILHVHMTTTMEGAREPSNEQIEAAAHRSAKRDGVNLDGVASLNVSRQQWDSRGGNQVNLKTNTLVTN
jgi:hypothetical protein